MKHLIAPSILSADFSYLQKDIEMINESEADWIHADIMDGVFVPNISFGFPVLKSVAKCTSKPIDVHLMIVNPDPYIKILSEIGVYMVSIHYETCIHIHKTLQSIKSNGMKCSIALNPHTPVVLLTDIIEEVDQVLLMSVNPGFGNQKFIEHTYSKVRELRRMINKVKPSVLIEVDGGVNDQTGRLLLEAGADVLVAGGYVFNSTHPFEIISKLKKMDNL